MKADLVVFGEDWGGHPSSTQHIVSRLARDRRVLWVNSIGLRRPRLSLADLRRVSSKLRLALDSSSGAREASAAGPEGSVTVLAPLAVSWPGNPLARLANRRFVGRRVRHEIKRLGFAKPILWTSLPTAVDLVGTLGERANVYYCGDDFGSLEGVDHAAVTALETELAQKADLILAASQRLVHKFDPKRTWLLPHGVDFNLFSTAAPAPADLPEGTKVAGFFGSLSSWIDLKLVEGAARLLPDWTFVLIGPARTDLAPLRNCPNVKILGERSHGALPAYAQNWTASLLPFRDNDQIRSCNPLKLREYLAAGRPIVSTEFPALEGYRDLVSVVGDPAELAAALRQTVNEPASRTRERRRRVEKEGWDERAREVSTLLDGL